MKVLLKAATIVDPNSDFHKQIVDIYIEKGIIKQIGQSLIVDDSTQIIEVKDLHVSPGWFDASVCIGEPGYEERETVTNALTVAAKSGFTHIAVHPNSNPIIDSSATLSFLKNKAWGYATSLHPIGALTVQSKGIDLAELYDMQQQGAIAFGDYKKAIENPNLLKLALLYTQNFNGLVQSYPQENQIAGKGIVNEEEQSTLLGLKGIPALAEELQIARDLYILEYTGGKLHIPTISTAKAVTLIREAKAKGLQVTCSVTVHHLALTDTLLQEFDTNYKVQPPLRSQQDVKALIQGVNDRTIDMITSDHRPMDIEHKKVEFDNAAYGTIGLESAYGICATFLDTETIVKAFTAGRTIYGISDITIEEGAIADLTLFSTQGKAIFTEDDILSTSKNTAFINQEVKGHVYGIYANQQLILKS